MKTIALDPPRVIDLDRVGAIWVGGWSEMLDGRQFGHRLFLRGRSLIEARREVETIWPGNWEWSNGRGRRVSTP